MSLMPAATEPAPPRCGFCGATDVVPRPRETAMVRSAFDCRIFRCRQCQLRFAWPPPAAALDAYEGEYFEGHDDAGLAMPAEASLPRYERRLASVAVPPGRLLDVGVGHGGFLAMARRVGWTAIGLDVSRWAADQVRRRYDIDVRVGPLEPDAFPPGSFEVVHLSHVLEHVPDPVAFLRTVRDILAPAGRVIIEVPNELENLYTWTRLRTGTARPYMVASPHLWFFSPVTLRKVVEAGGLRIDHAATLRDTADPSGVRRMAKRAVGAIERLLSRGPLIEVIATRPDRVDRAA